MGHTSTNALGRTHFGGDVVAGGSKPNRNGVKLNAVSTGQVASVQAVGDDANVDLALLASSTDAGIRIGSTANTAWEGMTSYTVQFTVPEVAAHTATDSSYTVAGVTTNSIITATPRLNLHAGFAIGSVTCSTADSVAIRWVNQLATTNGTGASTNRATITVWNPS